MVSQKKIGSILSYVTIFVKALITIIYTPIMIGFLGDAEFGVYNLSYSVVSYLGLLSLGFGGAYVRFYYRYETKDDEEGIATLNGLFLSLFTFISVLSLVCGYFLVENIELIIGGELTQSEIELSKVLMQIMIINVALTFPDSVFNSYITAKENFIFQRIVALVRAILNPLLGIPLLLLGYRSIGLSVAITLATLISLILNAYYAFKKLDMKVSLKNPNFGLLKEIAIFSSYIFLNMVIDQVNWQLDKIILGKYVGSIAVAVYSVGSQINTFYMQFSTSISSVFVPQVNSMIQGGTDKKSLTSLMTKVGRIQLYVLALILIGFTAIGKYFITEIWVGESYLDSFFVALILITPVTIPLIQNIGIEIQKSMNRHKFRSLVYLFIAIFNVIISIPLAKMFGPIGSAIGTSLTTFIGHIVIMNIYYHKSIGIDMISFWKSILSLSKGFIIPISISIVMAITEIRSNFQFIVYGIVIVLVYIISVWKFSFNDYEKSLVRGPIKKIKSKNKRS